MVLVVIRSRRRAVSEHGHPALRCLPSGEVEATAFGPAGKNEQWDLDFGRDPTTGALYLTMKGSNGFFLSANNDGSVYARADTVGDSEKWFLENVGEATQGEKGCVSLQSCSTRKYLVADCRFDCGKMVRADRENVIDWTQWLIVDHPKALTHHVISNTSKYFWPGALAVLIPTIGIPVVSVVSTLHNRAIAYGGAISYSVIQKHGLDPQEPCWVLLKVIEWGRRSYIGFEWDTKRKIQMNTATCTETGTVASLPMASAVPTTEEASRHLTVASAKLAALR